jgi:ABC-type arginine transport system permease subunit
MTEVVTKLKSTELQELFWKLYKTNIQGVPELISIILTTSCWLHIRLGKNI